MKKILYTIMLFLICIGITNAAKCNVVSGTGKNTGDEIACGTEHFYVISNDGTNVKMLSKYNLLVGTNLERIEFNVYEGTKYNDIYKSKEVQQKMQDGYTLYDSLYEYDDTSSKYFFYGALMRKDLNNDTTAIFFNSPISGIQEALTSPESKKVLEQGYNFYGEIKDGSGNIIGLSFEKEEGYEYKTIIFDEVKKINYQELYKIPEIKQYLDQGYAVYHEFFNNHICDSTSVYCTEDFYGIVLYKSYTEDYYNIIFNQEFTTTTELDEYLSTNEEYQQKIKEGYDIYDKYYNYEYASSNSKYMRTFGIVLSKNSGQKIKKDVYQHETAIGAHGDEKGKPDPIEIGVTYLGWEIYYREDGNLDLADTPPGEYLTQYQETLKKSGYNIDDIYLLTMDDLLNLLSDINNVEADWDNLDIDWEWEYDNTVYRTSLLNVIPEKYSWIYSTTYWTASDDGEGYVYFVDTLGDLCSTYNWCSVSYEVGAGIRPVVTIAADDLIYNIQTKTDGNGTIESTHVQAAKGEVIKFVITPNEGYVLSEVKVTDEEGNVITFTENTFTMPEANVTIEATFTVENSETSTSNILIAIIFLIISCTIFYKFKKKANWVEV